MIGDVLLLRFTISLRRLDTNLAQPLMNVLHLGVPKMRSLAILRIVFEQRGVVFQVRPAAGGVGDDGVVMLGRKLVDLPLGKGLRQAPLSVVRVQRTAAVLLRRRDDFTTVAGQDLDGVQIHIAEDQVLRAAEPFVSRSCSAAAQQEAVRLELLLAIARQESRFSPGVQSPVGAVGLLQLMPATAAEMAGAPISDAELRQPARNATLGARYLAWLLEEWQGNPWLTVASYNAGPGAAGSWLSQELTKDPELWVERIPYPETRLYTKKVLGNLWAYLRSDWASHDQSKSR